MIQYLLDEHVPSVYRAALLLREPALSVAQVGEGNAPAKGTLDPDILVWCEAYRYLLVTNNRRSMPVHLRDHLAAGRHVPGIFVINPDRGVLFNVEELILIAGASPEDEYQDLLLYLPITRDNARAI